MDAVPPLHDDDRVTLRPVGATDWRAVAALDVGEAQRTFVAEPGASTAIADSPCPTTPTTRRSACTER